MIKTIGITGSAGTIGKTLEEGLGRYYNLKLFDKLPAGNNETFPYRQLDIADGEQLTGAFDGLDALIHLAADIQPTSPWESIYRNNIVGTRNVFAEAARAGVGKVVFASTNHTQNKDLMIKGGGFETLDLKFYQQDRLLTTRDQANPDCEYAISKLFGENLGKLHSEKGDFNFVALRIGWIIHENDPRAAKTKWGPSCEDHMRAMFLSKRDCVEVFRRSVETDVNYFVGYAISNNKRRVFDLKDTNNTLHYHPRDNAELYFLEDK